MSFSAHIARISFRSWLLLGALVWSAVVAGIVAAFSLWAGDDSETLSIRAVWAVTALVLGVSLALAAVAAARLTRTVSTIAREVTRFAETGEISRVPIRAPREFTHLREALRQQGRRLLERQRELVDTNAELQRQIARRMAHEATLAAIFENTPFDLWTTDDAGTYTYQNAYARDLHGDVLGKTIAETAVYPALKADREARFARALAGEVVRTDLLEETSRGPRYYHILEAPIRNGDRIVGTLGVKLDLTEQHRAEEALRLSQRRISRHLENTPLGVVDFDEQFRIRSWNASAETIFGWSAIEAIGRLALFIVPPDEREGLGAVWQRLCSESASSRHFNRNVTRDGRLIDCEWYNTPITDEEGRIVGVSSLVLDVTDRITAERLFRESEERFNKAFHLSPAPQAILSFPEGRFLDVNQAWIDTFGHCREDVVERTDLELQLWFDPADRRRFFAAIDRLGVFSGGEIRLRHRAGDARIVQLYAARARLAARDCIVVSQADITSHLEAQNALRESRRFLETLVNQLPGMAFRCRIDESWTMTWVSAGCHEVTGYPAEAFVGGDANFGKLILPAHREAVWRGVQRAVGGLHGSRRYTVEYEILHRDGRARWMWEQGEIVRDSLTQLDEIVGFIADITERKLTEQRLRELNDTLELRVAARTADLEAANEKLQDLDRLKTEFLATMSHELRTPLNSILGFSSILERGLVGPLLPEQKHQLSLVGASARQLLRLISDLLDVSSIQSGHMSFAAEPVDIGALLQSVELALRPQGETHPLVYQTEIAPDLPIIISDGRRLRQIVANLVGNAIKFTRGPNGRVTVTARPVAGGGVEIEIRDNGIGIKPEYLPQLFEAFRQVDGSARRVYEGVGLGLHLVRKLVAKLGGRVDVESTYGEGSAFTVVLPPASPHHKS